MYFLIFFLEDVSCIPGTWSARGDRLFGSCTDCVVGFFEVCIYITIHKLICSNAHIDNKTLCKKTIHYSKKKNL